MCINCVSFRSSSDGRPRIARLAIILSKMSCQRLNTFTKQAKIPWLIIIFPMKLGKLTQLWNFIGKSTINGNFHSIATARSLPASQLRRAVSARMARPMTVLKHLLSCPASTSTCGHIDHVLFRKFWRWDFVPQKMTKILRQSLPQILTQKPGKYPDLGENESSKRLFGRAYLEGWQEFMI